MFRTQILLPAIHILMLASGQSTPGLTRGAQPVRDVTRPSDIRELDMHFGFQQPGVYHVFTVHFGGIDGEPARGVRYGVHASVSGLEAVRSLWFEMVNEQNEFMERIPMVPDDTTGLDTGQYVGMLTVPAEPFRIVIRGIAHDGRRFHGVQRQLFRPSETRPRSPLEGLEAVPVPAAYRDGLLSEIASELDKALAARERRVAANPEGTITPPATRVMNVEYEPYLSPSGRPLGLTVTYTISAEPGGRYDPGLRVVQEDPVSGHEGRDAMRPLQASITPRPHLYHAPEREAEEIAGLLVSDAVYKSGIRYRFTVRFVPAFVALRPNSTAPCLTLSHLRNRYDGDGRYKQMIAHRGASTYRVYVWRNAFEGRIDGFPGEGTLYQNWVDEGTVPCREAE